ncbi:MAG: hypothetical protein HY735_14585 [Verrucomicrobia bacterium]|nr:hypothetical protein [Verrucomicrobiota bacterium]
MNFIAAVQAAAECLRVPVPTHCQAEAAAAKERKERKDHPGLFSAVFAFLRGKQSSQGW